MPMPCDHALCEIRVRGERYETIYDQQIGDESAVPVDASPAVELAVNSAHADRVTVEVRARTALVLQDPDTGIELDIGGSWSGWAPVHPLYGAFPLIQALPSELPAPSLDEIETAVRGSEDAGTWERVAAACDPSGDASTCWLDRVATEVRVTAWRGRDPVEQVVFPVRHRQ